MIEKNSKSPLNLYYIKVCPVFYELNLSYTLNIFTGFRCFDFF